MLQKLLFVSKTIVSWCGRDPQHRETTMNFVCYIVELFQWIGQQNFEHWFKTKRAAKKRGITRANII